MMDGSPVGVLVMAYGGPESPADVEPYLMDVRGYRATPATVVQEVRERYVQIGGRSPILERTRAQAQALQRALNGDGRALEVVVAMRHWHPFIKDVLPELADRGVRRLVGLVMAPHFSRMSVARYFDAARDAAVDVDIAAINDWHRLPGYIGAVADRVRDALARFPRGDRAHVPVVFTAHSLPERIHAWDDPYPRQLRETVQEVMGLLGSQPHRLAYQSAAMTPEPWLGPDVGEVLDELAAAGRSNVVVAPIGFVCEHVEILYDIDIELSQRAARLGMRMERIDMLNDHQTMIADLAHLVRARAIDAGWL